MISKTVFVCDDYDSHFVEDESNSKNLEYSEFSICTSAEDYDSHLY